MDLKIIKIFKYFGFLLLLFITFFITIFFKTILHQTINNHQWKIEKNRNLKIIKNVKNLEEKSEEQLCDDIIILFTNDVHCAINNNIGYDGLFLLKKELKRKYKTVLIAETGDAIQGGTVGILSKGMDIVKIMNYVGYDVATLGNHEFDYGLDQLDKVIKAFNNTYICANCCFRKNKTSILPPYKIITTNQNIKIAFIGIITPQTLTKTSLHSVKDIDGKPIYDFLTGNNGTELYETIQKYINEVKAKGADYVIILAHLGNGGDSLQKYTTDNLISHLTGVDLLLDGHSHLVYNTFSEDKKGNLIPIMQTGDKLNNIGMIKIIKNREIITEIISDIPKPSNKEKAEYVLRKNKMKWVDKDMKNKLEGIIHQYDNILNRTIGKINFDMPINNSRDDENILCNFIVDSIRYMGNAEVSIINSGNVRNNLIKGNITYQNILDILPFYNYLVIKEIKGLDILDALEFGVKNLPNKAQRFPQVSGITFDVNTKIPSSVEVDENEMFLRVNGKRRVSGVIINGEELSLERKYKVCLPYFIARGGDGYSMLAKYDIILNMLITDTEATIMYIEKKFNENIPDYYRIKQGRIVIDSKEEFDIFLKK